MQRVRQVVHGHSGIPARTDGQAKLTTDAGDSDGHSGTPPPGVSTLFAPAHEGKGDGKAVD